MGRNRRVRALRSEAALDEAITSIGASQRAFDAGEAETALQLSLLVPIRNFIDERIQAIQIRQAARKADHAQTIAEKLAAILGFVEARWSRLGRSRTVIERASGTISRRQDPKPRIEIADEEHMVERLKALGLTQFIRVTEGVDREAMHAARALAESVEGVTFVTDETLTVEPTGGRKEKGKFSQLRELLGIQ